jgi:RimJ/RimL family protein N-acetyltransferase
MDSVKTERLLLRPFRLDDGKELHTIIWDDPDMTWDATARPQGRTRETLRNRLKHYQDHGFGVWAVTDRVSGEMLGQAGLQMLQGTGNIEAVTYIAKKHWRQNIGFEATIAALTYGFLEMGLPLVVVVTRPRNVAGWSLAEKLGFHRVREDNAYGDSVYYYELAREDFALRNQFYEVCRGEPRKPRFDLSQSSTTYY